MKVWPRIIFHVDMDAFYAAVEQRDNPELQGKPVIIGGTGRRGVVSTASYEARAFGVHSAQPGYLARQRCPNGIFLKPNMSKYVSVSKQIMAIFKDYSPSVEPLSLDEAFLDMSGTEKLMGAPEKVATQLQDQILEELNLAASIGVAPMKYIAKVASDLNKPLGICICLPGEEQTFLAPLPIEKLWGVGKVTAPKVRALGLATIGDVARADPGMLERELKGLGRHISLLARGIDSRPVRKPQRRKSVGAERTLLDDISGEKAIMEHLRPLADDVAATLRKNGFVAGGVRLKLKTATFKSMSRDEKTKRPTDNADEMLRTLERLCARTDLDQPFRLIGMAAFDIRENVEARQPQLFAVPEETKASAIDDTLDAIKAKFGKPSIHRASHAPAERAGHSFYRFDDVDDETFTD